jgi:hypothetical protein
MIALLASTSSVVALATESAPPAPSDAPISEVVVTATKRD